MTGSAVAEKATRADTQLGTPNRPHTQTVNQFNPPQLDLTPRAGPVRHPHARPPAVGLLLVSPLVAGTAVLADGNWLGTGSHALAAEYAVQVVHLVGREPGRAVLECRDALRAVNFLMLDLDPARPGHHAAHVKEAQTSFVLLVLLSRLLDDPGIE
jgi:hypothetical protein